MSVAEELEALAGLRDRGILTDAEFESQKPRLLDPGLQVPSRDAAEPNSAAPRFTPSKRIPIKKINKIPVLIVGGIVAAVLAVAAIRVIAGINEPISSVPAAAARDQPIPDAPTGPAAPATAAATSTAAPSNWCMPGVRLNVKASENSWYAGTVKRSGEAGLCVVGEDGWNASWDRAVTVTQVAPEGSKVLFTGVGMVANAVVTDPNQLSAGVYACSMVPDNTPMPNLGWGIVS